ncbi:GNAT family N-acetyltransferase [Vagococcus zengguangii]|uniref:GNAT family N-acetyltransferase n=1 Tax=Vagococcus zengguangii TaxID=2571750 RepID=A0A4D7CNL8_9ENTE|nr:GNAT family N-acetyltransferase [Vagococcus zengguangii]QCI85659.1 GNAT family N-acetyltransferase [Vagococcus zengguangii]TLG81599.1 GNAT family N-acetyltransferase [Vagococcus zengguangii]
MHPYNLRELTLAYDEQLFYELILTTDDYFSDYQMTIPSLEEVRSEFWLDVPSNTQLSQKKLLGIFSGNELVGFVDVLLDYPESQSATLGYLVLHQKMREQGWGSLIYQQIETQLVQNNYLHMRLGVITDNLPAYHFWEKMGFTPYDTIITDYGEQTNMQKSLK